MRFVLTYGDAVESRCTFCNRYRRIKVEARARSGEDPGLLQYTTMCMQCVRRIVKAARGAGELE
jgi:hypothetical protein